MTDKQELTVMQNKVAYGAIVDGLSLTEVAALVRADIDIVQAELGWAYKKECGKRKRESDVFPNLAKWLRETKMSWAELASLFGRSTDVGSRLRRDTYDIRKSEIDIILDVTGMTYEECFAKKKSP